jgi:hypothetical protein
MRSVAFEPFIPSRTVSSKEKINASNPNFGACSGFNFCQLGELFARACTAAGPLRLPLLWGESALSLSISVSALSVIKLAIRRRRSFCLKGQRNRPTGHELAMPRHCDTARPRQPLRARLASATSRSCRPFLIASERAGPCGNFRAASRASSACASKSETSVCSAFILLRRREQRTFGPLGAGRFHPANRRRSSFHRVAPATLEHTVLESLLLTQKET